MTTVYGSLYMSRGDVQKFTSILESLLIVNILASKLADWIDRSDNDVKCECEKLHEVWLAGWQSNFMWHRLVHIWRHYEKVDTLYPVLLVGSVVHIHIEMSLNTEYRIHNNTFKYNIVLNWPGHFFIKQPFRRQVFYSARMRLGKRFLTICCRE